ncbi:unnamed protein product [Prunus armeniaca]|uniref:Uncharacterized protein n=1 Tax=Prunus armeniaca TaxID=36596 RepID=A0A6J5TK70_PRUAR|nr:unnamed protein product [Prunus armeniaca]
MRHTKHALKVQFFMRTMKKLWTLRACVKICQLEHGDRNCVVKGRPWTFENPLLILGETNGLENRHLVPLTTQPFWVRVKGVPLAFMERSTGQLIGDILGRFIETDSGRGGTCLGSFMKIKVIIDVTQPLKRCLCFTFLECSLWDSVINHGDFKNLVHGLEPRSKNGYMYLNG